MNGDMTASGDGCIYNVAMMEVMDNVKRACKRLKCDIIHHTS